MNLDPDDTKSFGGGFATASGKKVKISEEALDNARRLFKDEGDFENASTSNAAESEAPKPAVNIAAAGGFSTASGKPTTVSKAALEKAQMLFDNIDSNATTTTTNSSTPTTPSFGYGARLSAARRLQQNSSSRRSFQPPRPASGGNCCSTVLIFV